MRQYASHPDRRATVSSATADRTIRLSERFAACFADARTAELVEHAVSTMVPQRVVGIAEDLNDHDDLRHDPVLAVLAGKAGCEACGLSAAGRQADAEPAGSEPLSQSQPRPDGDRTAVCRSVRGGAEKRAPAHIILDLDATDDPLHGHQEGRFFHGYYDCYCYLPLYIFCDRHLLAAKLRRSNIDASAGAVEEVARIVGHLRACWPRVRILLRADAGFAREELMHWCEHNSVDFLFGLAKNARLTAAIAAELAAARQHSEQTGKPARRFKDFTWSTLDSWSRPRRVVGKTEWTGGEANPRFVVTSLVRSEHEARHLYEKVYCARGEMENRIKECQLDLFADRTPVQARGRLSATTMRANQLRLWFAAMAYVLVCALRRIALRHTQFAEATCGTIRLKLFKIGALVRVSVRRIKIAMASACPYQNEFALAHLRLTAAAR
jgi:Transposase DDE domain group 1